MNYDFNIVSILIGIVLTFISYMIYPFIRTKLMHVEYDEKTCKKMALWNSIIVGGAFLILTTATFPETKWNAAPAFLYYWINKKIWISKKKYQQLEGNNENNEYICSKCGSLVAPDDKYCKICNAVFAEEENNDEYETSIEDSDNEEKNFKCSNCGELVKESDNKCPQCGEIFEEENEIKNKDTEMEQKYSDLIKLKKLFDKDIITKEEFEKEKKKILNRK